MFDHKRLDLPIPQIETWSRRVLDWKVVPILWGCSEATATLSVEACEDGVMANGVLGASMLPTEIHWTLQFGVFDRLARLFIKLGYEKALIVQGAEGSEDLHINRPTRAYLVENGEFYLQIFDPETYGIEAKPPERTWTPADQLAVVEAVLQGEADLAYTNQVLFNGAVRLHLAGKADSVEQGLYACKALLDGGEAYAAYASWRTAMLEALGTVAAASR
ncbi:hypothetical protein ACFSR7_03190 [Cohnella sp. GCM10020058]|uniref:hypothetical protein n=1 Tax=Cohnella sp. GCM10020058 TaxID=3317330 RepID=UPI0036377FD3